tara:strand:+ start:1181 stop:1711 length:531 start_codon:yes stop_codon:yes gene_type:complete
MFDFGPVMIDHEMPMDEEPMGELDILDGLRAMSMFKRDPGPLKPSDLNQEVKHALAENPHCIQMMVDEGFFDDSLIRELEQMMHDSPSHKMMMHKMIDPGTIIAVQGVVIPGADMMSETGGPKKGKKKKRNIPTNPKLYARVKAEAKRKFKVYPSAYANGWLVREYKKRGGGYRKG